MKVLRNVRLVLPVAGAAIAIATMVDVALGQCAANEFAKLTASDAEYRQEFARSVSLSGDVALVGARLADNWEGAAYVYEFGSTGWLQEAKLTASDGTPDDQLGLNVALSGDVAVAGARLDDDLGSDAGSAYVFVEPAEGWTDMTETVRLNASDGSAGDNFGAEVAVDGNVIVVGATGDDGRGSAYVFRYDGENWNEEAKLIAADGEPGDAFGGRVAICSNVIVVGVWADNHAGQNSGSAYVFRYDGADWNQEAKLTASDAAPDDLFGTDVSVSGNLILIGASGDDDLGSLSGSAYVFRYDGAVWSEQAKLFAWDAAAEDRFGSRLSIDRDIAVIGSWADDDHGTDSGSAYVFQCDCGGWTPKAKVTASDAGADHWLGTSVSVSGDAVLIGAWGDDHAGWRSGSAYVFQGLDDCNENGELDICDLADGSSQDDNANGIPDECERIPGDINGDGCVDQSDLGILLAHWGEGCP